MTEEIGSKYFHETAIAIQREGFQVEHLQNGHLNVLANFNGTVLACTDGEFGVEFVTWDWDFNRDGVSHGHYFGGDYSRARQDFVTRSGLIPEQRIFTDDQLCHSGS